MSVLLTVGKEVGAAVRMGKRVASADVKKVFGLKGLA
jgi:hypothetical protein